MALQQWLLIMAKLGLVIVIEAIDQSGILEKKVI